MKLKIIIPIAMLAVVLSVVGVMSMTEPTQNQPSPSMTPSDAHKMITVMSADERSFNFRELVDASDIIIEGKIVDTQTIEKKIDPEHRLSTIFTVATVKVSQVLKGESEDVIQVQLYGGETENRILITERLSIEKNDNVIMFLELDPENDLFAGNYNLVAQMQGLYKTELDQANNIIEERTIPTNELKRAIKSAVESLN